MRNLLSHLLATEREPTPSATTAARPLDEALLLEQLSDRLLADFPVAAWRHVFLRDGRAPVDFRLQPVTSLCCDPPASEWPTADLAALASRSGAEFEARREAAVFRFTDARAALGTALLLQRASRQRLRAAILTRAATLATFELFGEPRTLILGAPPEDALAWLGKSIPGSIQVCAQTYRALGSAMDGGASGAMVTTEYVGSEVTSAFVTLPPHPRSEVSTFAGLGPT